MHDALILAPSGRVWIEPLARCLGDAGLRAQRVTATEAECSAGAAPRRARGRDAEPSSCRCCSACAARARCWPA
ncbi:hypothetical protein ACTMU2_20320 [Cupriavidus basilensis]